MENGFLKVHDVWSHVIFGGTGDKVHINVNDRKIPGGGGGVVKLYTDKGNGRK